MVLKIVIILDILLQGNTKILHTSLQSQYRIHTEF